MQSPRFFEDARQGDRPETDVGTYIEDYPMRLNQAQDTANISSVIFLPCNMPEIEFAPRRSITISYPNRIRARAMAFEGVAGNCLFMAAAIRPFPRNHGTRVRTAATVDRAI